MICGLVIRVPIVLQGLPVHMYMGEWVDIVNDMWLGYQSTYSLTRITCAYVYGIVGGHSRLGRCSRLGSFQYV